MSTKLKLHQDEKVVFKLKPKPSLAFYMMITKVLRFLLFFVVLAVYGLLHLSGHTAQIGGVGMYVIVALVIIGIYGLFSMGQVSKMSYVVTDKRIIKVSDFINYNKKILNYSLLNGVDMATNIMRRIFGISAVVMQQPGSTTSANTYIDGLSHDDAEKLLDFVSEKMTEKK